MLQSVSLSLHPPPPMSSIIFSPCFKMESQYCQAHFKGHFNNTQVVYRTVKVNEILDKIIIFSKTLKRLGCWIALGYNANQTPKSLPWDSELQTNVQKQEPAAVSGLWSFVSWHIKTFPNLASSMHRQIYLLCHSRDMTKLSLKTLWHSTRNYVNLFICFWTTTLPKHIIFCLI